MVNVERYNSVFGSKDSATYTVKVETPIPFIMPISGHLQSSACSRSLANDTGLSAFLLPATAP